MIDTGAVAEPTKVPVAATVLGLLPQGGGVRLPLLVVHTHRHLDHRGGDGQFAGQPSVKVIGYDLASVKRFYGFDHRRIRKGFLRSSLHEPLEHVISECGRWELSGSADWESMGR